MKVILFVVLLSSYTVYSQWNPSGDNVTSGQIIATNPNNTSAVLMLSWLNDLPRIRVGGFDPGASNGLDIQGPGDVSLLRIKGNGELGVKSIIAKEQISGGLTHTKNYFVMRPYSSSYDDGSYAKIFYDGNNKIINFWNSEAGRLTNLNAGAIRADGRMAIGTSFSNEYHLAVNGKIKAKEIKVETNWSDFVFEKDYNLPSLKEVEKHIKEKGHLKDIPSSKEVERNGIDLGEINSRLLQKIEELTLYTIQQQKLIESQNKRIEKLENLCRKM
ncbi:hypothetical protein HX109_10940 [Galbibacter sp. BG1]|uniref:hypothetical protein n=1 Tax=Galbibacter sp. BG1 TaxID=1170699 RepID=UPI0015BA0F92|nr:hypothetical protein [Galbibacter sp. BG1]QLE02044.1 hypothetical protein HX109_10940 [Galbibacter sp. BG1]